MPLTMDTSRACLDWAAATIGNGFKPKPDAVCVGWRDEGGYRAAGLYEEFTPFDCEMHVASDGSRRWATRHVLERAFHFPFVIMGLRRVTGYVAADNEAALKFDLHLGFRVEGVKRAAVAGRDIIMVGMLREECRFIPSNYRKA